MCIRDSNETIACLSDLQQMTINQAIVRAVNIIFRAQQSLNNTTPIEYSQISAYLINNDIPFIQFWLAVSPDSIRTQLSILSANVIQKMETFTTCLLYTSPSPRDS
eukprot:TRINITY_DN9471_c0_g1_i3.p1 TRINITY_DN9471_c0_g1~~TRINITY_DN9471_c0_g1_i3.p1  ORF type:complete len:106 (+),score=19.05 TRINITY_DN9471_c0_g1_i3:65-382(+)